MSAFSGIAGTSKRARPWSADRGYALMLAPPLLLVLFFFACPLIAVVLRSVTEPEPGFANYVEILRSDVLFTVLARTFLLAFTVTLVTLLLGYPVAWIINGLRGPLLYMSLALVVIPFWTSVVIRSYAWLVIFQRRGMLNDMLLSLGAIAQPLRLMNNTTGVHIGLVHLMLPFMVLPLLNSMRQIDATYLRAASVLGANPLRQFFHVYLPLTLPGISAGCLLVFISTLGAFITPALLGGPENMMISVLIEQQANRILNWPMASTLATILLVATGVLYVVYERASRRFGAAGPFGA